MSSAVNTQNSYDYEQLIRSSEGSLFGRGFAQLPSPPMLMLDRVTDISHHADNPNKGQLTAELDIKPELWFFQCHFHGDPVMPGCLGLDAMWQLVGFWLAWSGFPGRGRALGVEEVKFSGQVTQDVKLLRYEITIKRVVRTRLVLGIADGATFADDKPIYHAKNMKVGLITPPKSDKSDNMETVL